MVYTYTSVPPVKTIAQMNAQFQEIYDALNLITNTGVGAGPYSYYVRKSGAVYEAYNSSASLVYGGSGDEGGVDGDKAADVINACLDASAALKTIFVAAGTYTLDDQIVFDSSGYGLLVLESGVTFNFDGASSPFIQFDGVSQCGVICFGRADIVNVGGAASKTMIQINYSSYTKLWGLYLDGNDGADSIGLEFNADNGEGNAFCDIKNVRFQELVYGVKTTHAGTGFTTRNRFYNVYFYDCSTAGLYLDGTYTSGNTFISCEFAHCGYGVYYDARSAGGNNFLGCTWDTNDTNAVYFGSTNHRACRIIGGTIFHSGGAGATDAFAFAAGTWAYGDMVHGVSGEAYSESVGTGTITAGNTSVALSFSLFEAPNLVLAMPTGWTGDMTLVCTAKSATGATINISGVYGSNINFMYVARMTG